MPAKTLIPEYPPPAAPTKPARNVVRVACLSCDRVAQADGSWAREQLPPDLVPYRGFCPACFDAIGSGS